MKIPGLEQIVPGLMLSNYFDIPSQEEINEQPKQEPASSQSGKQNPDAFISLLDDGVRLDAMDLQGQTPLMWAAQNGEVKIAKQLLKAGADVNAADWWGRTALTFALTQNNKDFITLLIEHKAKWE
ncbi:MAG: ankyrin repeat domain-containing protein [Magnetococcales bacterium]|nr:ankyrin repeat domain-containing protein [Magnetococcales bacterium]